MNEITGNPLKNSNPYELLNSLLLTHTDDILHATQTLLSANSSVLKIVPEFENTDTQQLQSLKLNAFKSPQAAALIVIDLQWDFIRGSLRTDKCEAKQDGENIIDKVNMLLEMAFKQIYLSQDWHPADHCSFHDNRTQLTLGPSSKITNAEDAQLYDTLFIIDSRNIEREQKLWPKHCIANTEGAKFHPLLKLPKFYIPVLKGTMPTVESYSVFGDPFGLEDTGLHGKLQEAGIKTVVLCGIAFDVCVASTAIDAIRKGYHVIVVEDACVGISLDGIRKMRLAMLQAGVHITTTSKIANFLAGKFLPVQHVINAIQQFKCLPNNGLTSESEHLA